MIKKEETFHPNRKKEMEVKIERVCTETGIIDDDQGVHIDYWPNEKWPRIGIMNYGDYFYFHIRETKEIEALIDALIDCKQEMIARGVA